MMTRFLALAALVATAGLVPGIASAAQRTFVASYGNDANLCTRALPCRTFAAAIGLTDSGGEVIALDSAGFGPVTIAQSVSLIAPSGVYAGITALAGQDGVSVNGAGVRVALRGLHVNGLAGSDNGVQFVQGAALEIDRCTISGFDHAGVRVYGGGEIYVNESTVRANGGSAIHVEGVHAPNLARLAITRTHAATANYGIYAYGNARILLSDSVIADAALVGVAASGANANDLAEIVVDRSSIVHGGTGVHSGVVPGALGSHRIIVDQSAIAWNSTGWNVRNDAATELYTRANSVVRRNFSNTAGKAAVVLGGN
jgi:hypothetical protein